jgi:cell division protein FtsN
MARRNARRKKSSRYAASSASSSPFFGMIWLVLGVLAGLLIAAVFYLKQQHKFSLDAVKSHSVSHPHVHAVQEQAPQFDFYHILPNSKKEAALASTEKEKEPKVTLQVPEVKTLQPDKNTPTENASTENVAAENALAQEVAEESRYMVQIASVRNYEDADKLKAQLSLMGFAVTIQKITSGDIILNRVVVGPYSSLVAAQEQQKRLRENEISSIVVKLTS